MGARGFGQRAGVYEPAQGGAADPEDAAELGAGDMRARIEVVEDRGDGFPGRGRVGGGDVIGVGEEAG